MPARIAVVAIGSVLMTDDGVGPWVLETLRAHWVLPEGVELIDAGTPGPELIQTMCDFDALVVIDAVEVPGAPGEVKLFRKPDLKHSSPGVRLSPHDPGLTEAILAADFAGTSPADLVLVGVVPGRVELGSELTDRVRAAVPAIEAAVLRELTRLGVAATPREPPVAPTMWWLRTSVS